MSDIRQMLLDSSLDHAQKQELIRLYNDMGNTATFRTLVAQAFQAKIEATALAAGVVIADDPVIQEAVNAHEEDVGALVATLQATIEECVTSTTRQFREIQPELDASLAATLRARLQN